MIKKILYAAVIGFIIGFIGMNFAKYNTGQGKYAYVEFTNIFPINTQINDVYVITDRIANTSEFFKVIWTSFYPIPGNTIYTNEVKMAVMNGKSILKEEISYDWVINAYKDYTLYEDTLEMIHLEKLEEKLKKNPNKVLKIYTQIKTLESSLFRKIIQSPGGAFLIILVSFLVIGFFTSTNDILGKYAQYFPKFGNLVFLVYINSFFFENYFYTYNFGFSLLFSFLSLIPIYLVYQFINNKFLLDKDIGTREFFKFLLLLIGGIAFQALAFVIINYLYSFVQATHSSAANIDKSQLYLLLFRNAAFWWLCIAIGNILNNLRIYFLDLQYKEKQLDFAKQKELQSQAELDALQARVNPHFLYNSLNSIAGLVQEDPAKTEEMAIALSHFFKYNTNRQTENWSTIAREIEMLETYLDIEKIRFGDRLQFSIDCPTEILEVKIPRFLLQPLVENAIKYGYQETTNTIAIRLEIGEEGNQLFFKIFDGGKPFPENISSGYGLQSIRKKLELLFPNQHELAFINEPEKHVLIKIEI